MHLSNLAAFGSLIALVLAAPLSSSKPQVQRRQWDDWGQCTAETKTTRVDFASMPEWERKSFTDAMLCMQQQPSQLDQTMYPAAINKYFDYAVTHVSRTQQVHISGFFLTWHRMFIHLFEQDLRSTCGYTGRWPYWNFAETAGDITNNVVFDGSEYSMSGDGLYVDTGSISLGPQLTIPHGDGGGCVTTGPFANMMTTLGFIDASQLQTGVLPKNAYALNESCLMRDLNPYVAETWTNMTQVVDTTYSSSAYALELALNGVIGSASLGVHSAAHFSIGGQMNSIHVSAQDPIWYPLHTFIDLIYTSWQTNNPDLASDLYGTETALNVPPTANVTLSTAEPDWGYFGASVPISDLISTTAGPFCYQYDQLIS